MDEVHRPIDVAGIASLVLGILATGGCIGTCIPYIGFLFMLASMACSFFGALAGAAGLAMARSNEESQAISVSGLILNAVVLLLWLAYWVFIFGATILVLIAAVVFVIVDSA